MKTSKIFSRLMCLLMLCSSLVAASSCSMMDDDNDYCATSRRVRFVFDRNMLFTDALSTQVERITLCAYRIEDGTLAYRRTVAVADLKNGTMNVDDLAPGHYHLLVWADGTQRHADSFSFGPAVVGSSQSGELTARLNRDEQQTVAHDVTPLFHGEVADADFTDLNHQGTRISTVYLTKDTNVFRVVLQNLSGDSLRTSDFDFSITDRNGFLAADNSLLHDSLITYKPWSLESAKAGVGTADGSTITGVSAVVAELTTCRLIPGNDMRLVITRRDDGKVVVNIPLIDYCLLVKGNYNRTTMSDLEYLDRQDTYELVFFIDSNRNWLSASICINKWRIVLQNTDM